jgi:hypothetical protein
MASNDFAGIVFRDPDTQAAFDHLVAAVVAAEQARVPLAQRHAAAERDLDAGQISEAQFRALDDQYIAANNQIAAAKRAVDRFLTTHRAYTSR